MKAKWKVYTSAFAMDFVWNLGTISILPSQAEGCPLQNIPIFSYDGVDNR